MWDTGTPWFDVALMTGLIMVGEIVFGRFEEHRPRGRRVLKVVLGTALFVAVSVLAGRGWMFALLGVLCAAVAVVHGWWLPKQGVNGWTAEPRERYLALRGVAPEGRWGR